MLIFLFHLMYSCAPKKVTDNLFSFFVFFLTRIFIICLYFFIRLLNGKRSRGGSRACVSAPLPVRSSRSCSAVLQERGKVHLSLTRSFWPSWFICCDTHTPSRWGRVTPPLPHRHLHHLLTPADSPRLSSSSSFASFASFASSHGEADTSHTTVSAPCFFLLSFFLFKTLWLCTQT